MWPLFYFKKNNSSYREPHNIIKEINELISNKIIHKLNYNYELINQINKGYYSNYTNSDDENIKIFKNDKRMVKSLSGYKNLSKMNLSDLDAKSHINDLKNDYYRNSRNNKEELKKINIVNKTNNSFINNNKNVFVKINKPKIFQSVNSFDIKKKFIFKNFNLFQNNKDNLKLDLILTPSNSKIIDLQSKNEYIENLNSNINSAPKLKLKKINSNILNLDFDNTNSNRNDINTKIFSKNNQLEHTK